MDLRTKFGGCIRSLRNGRSITQDELAERSGLSVDSIRRIERGALSPSLETIQKLADGLDVSLTTLFGGLEDGRGRLVDEICDLLERQTPPMARMASKVLRAMFPKDPGEDGVVRDGAADHADAAGNHADGGGLGGATRARRNRSGRGRGSGQTAPRH